MPRPRAASPGIPGIAETPRPGGFPGPPGTRHLVPLVTRLRGLSPSLERPGPCPGTSRCISLPLSLLGSGPFPPPWAEGWIFSTRAQIRLI